MAQAKHAEAYYLRGGERLHVAMRGARRGGVESALIPRPIKGLGCSVYRQIVQRRDAIGAREARVSLSIGPI